MALRHALVSFVFLTRSFAANNVTDDYDVLQYVDTLIGTTNGGDVFAGATLPYGMAKAVADTNSQYNQGGFTYDGSAITGFSNLHDSGTGGSPSLGNFALFPYASCENDDVDGCVYPKTSRATGYVNGSVAAVPGYFGLTLDSGIIVDMTVAHHTSLFRFRFPDAGDNAGSPLILLDLTDLQDSRQDNATISVDPSTGRMQGSGRFLPSFGSGTYEAFFCADFQSPSGLRDNGVFVDTRASTDVKALKISRGINGYPLPGGGFVRFKPSSSNTVLARVGLSFISSEQACSNAEAEIPNFDFNTTYFAAVDAWRQKLNPIKVSRRGVDKSTLINFYSGVYRTMVNPQDYTGYTQGGSNADNIIGDAFVKGLTDGIDWEDGYAAVKKDAEEEPYDWSNEGRGGMVSWKSLNYIPEQDFDYIGFGTLTRSISRTLEYSYNDYVISQMARGLNKTADAEKYETTSGYWQNLFKRDQRSYIQGQDTGFQGFFQPRYLNKTWGYQDPITCSNIDTSGSPCSLQSNAGETFESSIWEYQFFVPHDMATLITLLGGPSQFVKRLDYLHDKGITYIGNEPAFLTVYQYHYAGRPAKSALRSHFYIPAYFKTTPDGLPGNDDSGAMGSFVAMSMMGLFPNPGQSVYLITPPYFESVHITSPLTNRTATVRVTNFDPTYTNVYIQHATLNGKPYTKNWIDHSFFTEGMELVLTLGRNESSWGTRPQDLPPSLSTK
ncbi:hypothetical protein Plec18170_000905 [Paecilomyces lecythidis]